MIAQYNSLLKDVSAHFCAAEALLSKGKFEEFVDEWIAGRAALKKLPPPAGPLEPNLKWRQLNDTFECLFEYRAGTAMLAETERDLFDYRSPNFLGAKADLTALRFLERGDASRLVFAGSGAYPQSLFYLAAQSAIEKLVGIDLNPERAFFSKQLVNYCQLQNKIEFAVCDAAEFDYGGANLIIVASLINGKSKVLSQILRTAPADATILLRKPRGWGALFYEDLDVRSEFGALLNVVHTWTGAADSLFETLALTISSSPDRSNSWIPHYDPKNPLNTSFR